MKSRYRTKESEIYLNNIKDTNSDIRSINIGSDIVNAGGILSNGATSNRNYNYKMNTPFKQTTTESEDKPKKDLQNIVRKIYLN